MSDAHNHRDNIDIGEVAEGPGVPSEASDIKELDSGRFLFRAAYSDSEFDGRALSIDVSSKTRPKKQLVHTLHQLSRFESPVNIHGPGPDGHGFTGLVYVNDPYSQSELQYYCWHVEDEN